MPAPVVLLVGGRRSRLLPYRTVVPKPLLPIGDRSVLERTLSQLAQHGFVDVTLVVGELGALIRAMLGTGTRHGVRIRYAEDDETAGAAGILATLPFDEPFLLMNGSVLTTLDYQRLWETHAASQNAVTIATQRRAVQSEYSVLHLADDGGEAAIVHYVERPTSAVNVSMGVYALQPEVRSYVDAGETLGMAELVNRLLGHGQRVGAFAHDGLWLDMCRRADYELAQLGLDEISQTAPDTATVPIAAAG